MFLSMAITFLFLTLISGILGFVVAAGPAAWLAKAVLFVFLVGLGVSLVMTVEHSSYHNKHDRHIEHGSK